MRNAKNCFPTRRDVTMGILTLALTDAEERELARRSRKAGMTKSAFVRRLIREETFVTGADVLAEANQRMDDRSLRISRKKRNVGSR
jgi:hypothetical protein